MSYRDVLAAPSRPTTCTPARRRSAIAEGSPPTTAIGTCSTAPAAALVAAGVTWTARCRGRIAPVTPAHSADRRMAPRLPGSVTPSSATRNGGVRPLRGDEGVQVRLGQRGRQGQHALGRLAPGLRREAPAADGRDGHPSPGGQLADVGQDRRVVAVVDHPHLADGPAPGDEQLAHGLAPLDLVAAEATCGPGRRRAPRRPGFSVPARSATPGVVMRVGGGRRPPRAGPGPAAPAIAGATLAALPRPPPRRRRVRCHRRPAPRRLPPPSAAPPAAARPAAA